MQKEDIYRFTQVSHKIFEQEKSTIGQPSDVKNQNVSSDLAYLNDYLRD